MKKLCLVLALALAVTSAPAFSAQASGSALTGMQDKAVTPGLRKRGGHVVFVQEDGSLFKNGKKIIKGYVYVFDKNGWTVRKYKYHKPGWFKKNGKYYWKQDDGKILKKTGLFKPEGAKCFYFFDKDYSRASGVRKVKGYLYYFCLNGKRYAWTGWKTLGGKKYYFQKNYRLLTGVHTVNGKMYLFNSQGALCKDVKKYTYQGRVYQIDSRGVMTLAPVEPQESESSKYCRQLTQAYINRHTSPGQSNYEKLSSCFYYLLAYQNFFVYPDWYYDLSDPDWRYKFAIDLLERGDLGGDCYGFACVVASCARELGYEPYVHVAAEDHCFVSINGLYYDNSGGGIFGGSYPSGDYTVTHIVKF